MNTAPMLSIQYFNGCHFGNSNGIQPVKMSSNKSQKVYF